MKALIFALILAASGCTRSPVSGDAPLKGYSIPELERVEFQSSPPREVNGAKISEFKSAAFNVTRIENIGPAAAASLIERTRFQIEALYQDEKSPYEGFLSKIVKCPAEFLPQIQHEDNPGFTSLRLQAAANGRRIWGVCNADEMQFHAVTLVLYCKKNQRLLQIEAFLPKTETAKAATLFKKVSC